MTLRPRHKFGILAGVAGLLAVACGWMLTSYGQLTFLAPKRPVAPAEPSDPAGRTLYVVNYAHLDTQWRWTFPQTIREYLPKTLERNREYIERFPDYTFNFTGASRYQLIEEYYPEQLQRLREWVKAGRWFPAGNQWEECDVLVPSSESILRQILYGRQYFRSKLDAESQEFMLPDSFGFPASLPSLLAHAGLRGFSTQKLTWDPVVPIPFNIGRWRGADNGSVVAALNAGDYGAKHREPLNTSAAWIARLDANGARCSAPRTLGAGTTTPPSPGLRIDYLYNGTGDTGGAPHEVSMRTLNDSVHSKGPIRILTGPADRLFRSLSDAQISTLPSYSGDLLLREHSSGSLTSQAFMKRLNRHSEWLASAAERASVMADLLGAGPYPADALTQAWKLTLRGQFHDILAGTSLPKAYEYSWNDDFVAINTFEGALTDSVAALTRGLDTQGFGTPIVVYNPLSIPRSDLVETEVPAILTNATEIVATSPEQAQLATQWVQDTAGRRKLLFLATVAADSLSVYELRRGTSPKVQTGLEIGATFLANDHYRIEVDASGDLSRIYDRKAGRELLSAPIRLAFQSEYPSAFPAWNMDWADRISRPRGYVEGPAQIRVVESGPLRVALNIERESEGSRFSQTIRLGTGAAGDIVEFVDQVDWKSTACSLKATFPWTIGSPQATYSWDLGHVLRGNNHASQYEVPTHGWIDQTTPDGSHGITLLTGAKYGSDKPDESTLRLTLLYTPFAYEAFEEQSSQDFGRHDIKYGIHAHQGDFRQGKSHWHAQRLEQPLLAFAAMPHPGQHGRRLQLIRVSSDQVAVQAIKRAESGSRVVVVRLQELHGRATEVALLAKPKILRVTELTGAEASLGDIRREGATSPNEVKLAFAPNQIRTIGLEFETTDSPIAPTEGAPVSLPYNRDAFSFNDKRSDGDFDGQGGTYPAEMLPNRVSVQGIDYHLGPRTPGQNNALECSGQTLTLPSGYSRLFLLAASAHGRKSGSLRLGGREVSLSVAPWTGRIGRWDNRVFAGKVAEITYSIDNPLLGLTEAYLNTDRIAWFASHHHHPSLGDVAYEYSYLYSYSFELAEGDHTVTLPHLPEVWIFAITVAKNDNASTQALSELHPDVSRDLQFRRRFRVR